MNKNQHNLTEFTTLQVEVVDKKIGLTSIQEQCALMLVAGSSVKEVATRLDIDRGTIYCWKKKIAFNCYLNKLKNEAREAMQCGLINMLGQAIVVLQQSLTSGNEALRIKTAFWIIEKATTLPVGASDPIEVIRSQCTEDVWSDLPNAVLNNKKFINRLKEEGLEE